MIIAQKLHIKLNLGKKEVIFHSLYKRVKLIVNSYYSKMCISILVTNMIIVKKIGKIKACLKAGEISSKILFYY